MGHNIQPLVHTIRSTPSGASLSAADEQRMNQHVSEISRVVNDIASRTNEAIDGVADTASAALVKHADPVVRVLEQCRKGLTAARRKEDMPPLAFRVARATKELVLRVERIESGKLTQKDNLEENI